MSLAGNLLYFFVGFIVGVVVTIALLIRFKGLLKGLGNPQPKPVQQSPPPAPKKKLEFPEFPDINKSI